MVINAFPMELDIQGITVEGNPDDEGAWIKWWDPDTRTYSKLAKYVSELYDAEGNVLQPSRPGWGDGDWVPVEKTFTVGEGFWWGVNKGDCTLCIPNPFYVEEK